MVRAASLQPSQLTGMYSKQRRLTLVSCSSVFHSLPVRESPDEVCLYSLLYLGRVDDSQNLYALSLDSVSKEIGKTLQHKFPCARHPAGTPSVWQ